MTTDATPACLEQVHDRLAVIQQIVDPPVFVFRSQLVEPHRVVDGSRDVRGRNSQIRWIFNQPVTCAVRLTTSNAAARQLQKEYRLC